MLLAVGACDRTAALPEAFAAVTLRFSPLPGLSAFTPWHQNRFSVGMAEVQRTCRCAAGDYGIGERRQDVQ
jgi:hypothetical protein